MRNPFRSASHSERRGLVALEWLNFFLADVTVALQRPPARSSTDLDTNGARLQPVLPPWSRGTEGTGRFNLVQGALATVVGIGAALSTTVGGALIEHFSYRISFLGLAGIALVAVALLALLVPKTRRAGAETAPATQAA